MGEKGPLKIAMIHQLAGGGATLAARALDKGAAVHGWELAWFPSHEGQSERDLETALDAFGPDLLHLHCWYQSYPLSAYARWLKRAPVAFTVHDVFLVNQFGDECWECYRAAHCLGCPALPFAKRWRPNRRVRARLAKRRCFSQSPRPTLILPSAWMGRRIARSEWRKAPRVVIPYGLDLEALERARVAASSRPPSDNTVLFIGHMYSDADHRKGLPDLLRAWPLVRKTCPTAELRIAGDIRCAMDWPKGVRQLGSLPPAEIQAELSRASIFCLPSRGDNSPLAVLEAMAFQKAIVATAVGGIPEQLADGAGELVPPRDERALADALIALLAEPERRAALGQRAKRHVHEQHGLEQCWSAHDQLYRSLVQTHQDLSARK